MTLKASAYEIYLPLCNTGADSCGRGPSLCIDGNAFCNSRAGSGGARYRWTYAGGGGTICCRPRITDRRGAALLQLSNSRGTNHDAAAAAWDKGSQGMAVARGAESGNAAGGNSRCYKPKRARGRMESSSPRIRFGVDGHDAVSWNASRPGIGAESAGQRESSGRAKDQLAGNRRIRSSGLCNAKFRRSAVGQRQPHPAGCGIQTRKREHVS